MNIIDDIFDHEPEKISTEDALTALMNLDIFISERFPGEYTTHPDISILEHFIRQIEEEQ